MEKVVIKASPIDQIEFNGEFLAELKWSLRNLAISAHATAYLTDTNNLVVTVDEWEDEAPAPQPHTICYVVISLAAIRQANNRGRISRWLKGDGLTTLYNGISPAFPLNFANQRIQEMSVILADKLGFGAPVLRQV